MILLDSISIGALVGLGLLYFVLPAAVLVLLIILFVRMNRKSRERRNAGEINDL